MSLLAGVLTILAPCIFPLLPLILGSSFDESGSSKRAFRIITSLLVSITLLTLLLHGVSNALGLNDGLLRAISSGLLVLIGVLMVFPQLWEQISLRFELNKNSNSLLGKAMSRKGPLGDILIGASLGPVFSSCSPTYGLIIATILPVSFFEGAFYLGWYILGLGGMFALLAILGSKLSSKISWATKPDGWFKRLIGILFLLIGLAVMFGLDKDFESWLLNWDFYQEIVRFELNLNN